VAAPSSVLQRFPLCPIESNGNENFKVIQNPGFLSDHPQNWITGSLFDARHTLKISERSVHNFLSYLANRQTDKQTVWQKHYLLGGGKYLLSFQAFLTISQQIIHVYAMRSLRHSCLLQASIDREQLLWHRQGRHLGGAGGSTDPSKDLWFQFFLYKLYIWFHSIPFIWKSVHKGPLTHTANNT